MSETEFTALIERCFPAPGAVVFATFPIPAKAVSYEVPVGKVVPLRCEPGDLRVGIIVGDRERNPVMVSALEARDKDTAEKLEPEVKRMIAVLIEAATEDRLGICPR